MMKCFFFFCFFFFRKEFIWKEFFDSDKNLNFLLILRIIWNNRLIIIRLFGKNSMTASRIIQNELSDSVKNCLQ